MGRGLAAGEVLKDNGLGGVRACCSTSIRCIRIGGCRVQLDGPSERWARVASRGVGKWYTWMRYAFPLGEVLRLGRRSHADGWTSFDVRFGIGTAKAWVNGTRKCTITACAGGNDDQSRRISHIAPRWAIRRERRSGGAATGRRRYVRGSEPGNERTGGMQRGGGIEALSAKHGAGPRSKNLRSQRRNSSALVVQSSQRKGEHGSGDARSPSTLLPVSLPGFSAHGPFAIFLLALPLCSRCLCGEELQDRAEPPTHPWWT